MRSIVACAAALSVAPLAAAGALSDEAALLQTKVHDGPAVEDNSFELICDELQGCHYRFHTSSTPTPYQLICDDKEGCRYTGVTQPPPKNPPPMLPQKSIDDLVKLANKAMAAPPAPKANPHANPNLADLMKNLKPPNMQQMPQMPWAQQQAPKAPQLSQMPQLPQMPDLGKWLQGLAPSTPAPSSGEPLAHFVPDNKMCCVQGPVEYVRGKLAKIKASPIGAGYLAAELVDGPCTSQGYDQGPNKESCFPQATLWLSKDHAIDPTSELKLVAAYALQHGLASAGKGAKEMCAP